MMLPFGFLPLDSLPKRSPRFISSRPKTSLTSALPTAEQDFPLQTKTWWRIGAHDTGASEQTISRSSAIVYLGMREPPYKDTDAVDTGEGSRPRAGRALSRSPAADGLPLFSPPVEGEKVFDYLVVV